jgi:hypothetical protein
MLVDLNRLRSRYETIAPWRRERAYSQLCSLLRSILLEDGHRFIALIAWSDSDALLSCIEEHGCGSLLADAIERFKVKDDARCAGLLAILARMNVTPVDANAVAARAARIGARLRNANIPAILLDEAAPPEFLVDPKSTEAATVVAEGAGIRSAFDDKGLLSTDTSFGAMKPYTVSTARGCSELNLVGKALYRAVRGLGNGVKLRDVYLLASSLRVMNDRERAALRDVLTAERREATRLEGIVQFAASLSAVNWDGGIGAKAYAAWLRRCGDLPARLRMRAHGVEASFALPGGFSHAIRILNAGAGRREALARVGSSVAGGVYALFL